MRLYLFLSVACLFGCDNFTKFNEPLTTDGQVHDLGRCSSLPDLTPPAAKCAAAKGLGGDNLVCVDFASITDQPLDDPNQLPTQLARPAIPIVIRCPSASKP